MPSGKQILLALLTEHSQNRTVSEDMQTVSERIKAGILLHGSSSNAMWKMVDEVAWIDQLNKTEGRASYLEKQGLGLEQSGLLLSDVFELITAQSGMREDIRTDYPALTPEAFEAGRHMIWLLLRAIEWSAAIEDVEDEGRMDEAEKERLLSAYLRKLGEYALDPDDYS